MIRFLLHSARMAPDAPKPDAPTVEFLTEDSATGDTATACVPTVETCNALDDDCDGLVDEEASDVSLWYADADGDGWGDDPTATVACPWPGAVARGGDCDDIDALVVTRCGALLLGDPDAVLSGTPMERVF